MGPLAQPKPRVGAADAIRLVPTTWYQSPPGLVLLLGRLVGPLGKVGGWALVSGLVWPQYVVHLCQKGG